MENSRPLKFIFFPPSPWSERARWALEYSGMPFETIHYTPTLSTPKVRWLTGNFTRKLTVPVAIHQQATITDSFEIAEYANEHRLADRQDLFPAEHLDDIKRWNNLSEFLLERLRIRAFPRMKNHRQLKLNNLPTSIPDRIKPWFLPLSELALSTMEKKYAVSGEHQEGDITRSLDQLCTELKRSRTDYLLGEFSYADITMAAVFQCIAPVDQEYVSLDPAIRECWTDPELAEKYKDLVAWRDRIYQTHRRQMTCGSRANNTIIAAE